ncbi:MAG: DUF2865 domain-containing protein [Pseudomonadota bacterium]
MISRGCCTIFSVLLLALAFLSFDMSPASAQSNLCRNLKAQLASLNRTTTNRSSKKYRQYDNAIRKQQLQIGKAQRAARRNGCTGIGKRNNNQCRRISDALRKMNANLASLKRTRASLSSGSGGNSRKRQRIIRQLEVNGCAGQNNTRVASAKPEKKSRRRTLLEQVFGVRTYNDRGSRQYGEDIEGDSSIFSRFGTYRTLCVRKSDGYYFPISFSTVPMRFDYDEELCQNMCPSSEVALYIHRMPSEDSEDMVSYRTDIPYAQEPFAFAYRKAHNPENRCRFSVAGIDQSVDYAATGETEETKSETIRIGVPVFRVDPSDLPDATDNDNIRLTLNQAQNYLRNAGQSGTAIADREFNGNKKIRIVGPAFFPVQ